MDSSLDQTVAALDGGLTNLSPSAATANIDGWIDTLDGNESLGGIADDLRELRSALTASPLDGAAIGDLLVRLGAQTRSAASTADAGASAQLSRLGGLLESAGSALGSRA